MLIYYAVKMKFIWKWKISCWEFNDGSWNNIIKRERKGGNLLKSFLQPNGLAHALSQFSVPE